MIVAGMSIVMSRVTMFRRLFKASRVGMRVLHDVAALDHLRLRTSRRAQHGGSHRTPGREQHGQQQQEPDANGLHEGSINRSSTCEYILNLATVIRSREALPLHGSPSPP